MAIGVEKLKDSGYSGLVINNPPNDGTQGSMTAPASFSLLATRVLQEVRTRSRQGQRRAHPDRVEES